MPGGLGGELAKRELHFIWIVDCSGSMQGQKIESLNFAIRETIEPMKQVAQDNPNAQVMVRAVKFSDGAEWHIAQPTDLQDFRWVDLTADGVTDMGRAMRLVADALRPENMPERGLPPVLVLLTDGQPTDDFGTAMKVLLDQPWGKRAVRVGIAIGQDADLDTIQKFSSLKEIKPLVATNAGDLVRFIKWASTVPLKQASNPIAQASDDENSGGAFQIPMPVPAPQVASDGSGAPSPGDTGTGTSDDSLVW
jgi:uncharacterized protein YegL